MVFLRYPIIALFLGALWMSPSSSPSSLATAQAPGSQEAPAASVYGRRSMARVAAPSNTPRLNTTQALNTTQDRATTIPVQQTDVASPGGFPLLRSNTPQPDSGDPMKKTTTPKNQHMGALVTVTSSLAVVLGLFAALIWVARKYGSKSMGGGSIPSEVLQNLGSTAIDPRTRISMIRLGSKILVVAQTATGMEPLSEITDPDEVRRLTALCVGDSKAQFASTLESIKEEPVGRGFAGQPATPPGPRHRGSLFTTA